MFNKLKMKIAARRVERKKARTSAKRGTARKAQKKTFWGCVREIVCAPFKFIARVIQAMIYTSNDTSSVDFVCIGFMRLRACAPWRYAGVRAGNG